MPRTSHWTAGNIVEIKLPEGWAYGKAVAFPLMAFFPLRQKKLADVSELLSEHFAFRIWVMKYAIGKNGWPLIGNLPVTSEESAEQWFSKKDRISGRLTKYRGGDGKEIAATVQDCAGLECAAVWDPVHVESRLQDEFAGRPSVIVESLKAK